MTAHCDYQVLKEYHNRSEPLHRHRVIENTTITTSGMPSSISRRTRKACSFRTQHHIENGNESESQSERPSLEQSNPIAKTFLSKKSHLSVF